MTETILTLWAKGTLGEAGLPRHSHNWAVARRGIVLRVVVLGWFVYFVWQLLRQ